MKASCYYCSSKNLTRAYQSLNFYKCEKCNIYARYPMPSSKELAVHYKSSYSYKNMTTNKIHQTSSISFNKIMAKYIFKKIMSKKQGTKLLDYGSGIGNLIYELMKLDIHKNNIGMIFSGFLHRFNAILCVVDLHSDIAQDLSQHFSVFLDVICDQRFDGGIGF